MKNLVSNHAFFLYKNLKNIYRTIQNLGIWQRNPSDLYFALSFSIHRHGAKRKKQIWERIDAAKNQVLNRFVYKSKWILQSCLFLPLAVSMLIVSCNKQEKQRSPKASKLKVFRSRLPYDPPVLDPRKGSEPIASTIHFLLFEGLTKITPSSTRALALAEKIDLSEDQRVYTFHLRDSVWSDETPVTAYDFEYSWKSMLSPHFFCPNAHLLYPIENAEAAKKGDISTDDVGIRALDEKTLEVTLLQPTPYFLDLTSFCVFSPVPKHIAEKNLDWADGVKEPLISNGPFVYHHWKVGSEIALDKNPLFWNAGEIFLDRIVYYVIQQEMTALNMFERGEIDVMGDVSMTDWIPVLKKQGKLFKCPVGATTFFSFNLDRPPFSNKHFRKAFSKAINRKLIVDNITQFGEEAATSFVASCLKGDRPKSHFADGCIESARKHLNKALDELGMTKEDLGKLTYLYTNNDLHRKIAQIIQSQIREALGIEIKLEENEFKVLLDRVGKRSYDLAQCMMIVQYNDRMNILDRFKLKSNVKNYPNWENPSYVDLLNRANFSKSEEERISLLEKAEKIMAQDMPISPIYHWNISYLQQPYIQGFFYSPIGSAHASLVRIEDDNKQNN